jgi:hypothetical protein
VQSIVDHVSECGGRLRHLNRTLEEYPQTLLVKDAGWILQIAGLVLTDPRIKYVVNAVNIVDVNIIIPVLTTEASLSHVVS